MEKKTTVLMILDGFGLNDKAEGWQRPLFWTD